MGSNRFFNIWVYLVILLFISGCVTDTASSSSSGASSFLGYGDGIKIKSFGFSSNKVFSGQPSVLSFDMQNLGAKDANDIYIYLYGLSSGDNEWFDDLSRIASTGANAVGDDPRVLKYDSLMSPIKNLNANGESAYISWILDAPKDLPEGQIFKYSAGVRVCYPYETTSTSKIEVLDDEEYLARDRENNLQKHPIIIDTSAGPLDVTMTTEQPMMLTERSKLTFRVKLVDRGSGTITENDCSDVFNWKDENILDLWVLHDKVKITLDGHGCTVGLEDLYFKASGSGNPTADFPVTCSIPRVDVPERSFDLKMKFEYNYFIDKGTDISVEGMGINNY